MEPAKRITALEGKTIALRWNGKNNGDLVLDRLAELLAKKYPTAKVVKTYRDMADQNLTSPILKSPAFPLSPSLPTPS